MTTTPKPLGERAAVRRLLDEDTEFAVSLLRDHMSVRLARVERAHHELHQQHGRLLRVRTLARRAMRYAASALVDTLDVLDRGGIVDEADRRVVARARRARTYLVRVAGDPLEGEIPPFYDHARHVLERRVAELTHERDELRADLMAERKRAQALVAEVRDEEDRRCAAVAMLNGDIAKLREELARAERSLELRRAVIQEAEYAPVKPPSVPVPVPKPFQNDDREKP